LRILGKSLKGKSFKLLIDNMDDLWHSYRRQEKTDDKLRPEKAPKKRLWLAIEVEDVDFHEFSNRLRVHGTIVRGPAELGLKSFHTLNYTPGSQLELEKPEPWRKHQKEILDNAVAATQQPQVTIIAIEDDNAVIAQLYQYGIRKLANIDRSGTGKMYSGASNHHTSAKASGDTKTEFFNNILLQLRHARPDDSPLIIVGPGFTKDDLIKFFKDRQLLGAKSILTEPTGQAGMVGIQEALRRGVVQRLVKDSRVSFETELVDKLLEGIAKDDAIVYGLTETEQAVGVGAVETLLVIDKLLRRKNEQLERLLTAAEASAGKVVVISSFHDAGKQLDALGGIAALLRYKI
jgi:protein pelota